jgi:hypothetical protein
MVNVFFRSLVVLGFFFPGFVSLSPLVRLKIETPRPGDVLQGVVPLIGSAKLNAFSSYELSFAYDEEEVDTWFLLAQSNQAVEYGNLGQWDTTTIADGNYQLKLIVYLLNGEQEEEIVRDLRVRNYTPVETAIPAGILLPAATSAPELAPTVIPFPTPTNLPANPAGIDQKRIRNSLVIGVSITFVLLAILGFSSRLHKWRRR